MLFSLALSALLTDSRHSIPNPLLQIFVLLFLASQGTAWFNTATLVTLVRNFPKSRGTVVGLLKSLVGLSSAIYTQIYTVFLAPDQGAFLSLLAFIPLAIVLPCMSFVRYGLNANTSAL